MTIKTLTLPVLPTLLPLDKLRVKWTSFMVSIVEPRRTGLSLGIVGSLTLLIPGALNAMGNGGRIVLKQCTLGDDFQVKTRSMPGTLNVMKGPGVLLVRSGILGEIEEDDLDIDIGTDTWYRELQVTAALAKNPYTKLLGTAAILRRFYTPSGAHLHSTLDHDKADIVTEYSEYQADVELHSSNGKIVVDYKFMKPAWLSFLYGPTVIEQKSVEFNLGESKTYETTQHTIPSNEVVALAIVAEWKDHQVDGDHEAV